MILAGVILKLGGYGLIRSLPIILNLCKKFNFYIIILALLSLINVSLICLRQNDLKSLVAYSSIVHIIAILIGILIINKLGFNSAIIIMIRHGLCSSGLFFLVNLSYENLKTRNFFVVKGIILIFPTLSMWWFLFCGINMSSPPRLNLLRELILFNILLN